MATDKHRVFISYHHALDQRYKETFVAAFSSAFIDASVRMGDIDDTGMSTEAIRQRIRDEWLRDTTVTIVLIGARTWQRKHVDWEIYSSLRDTKHNARSGLVGILLPSYPRAVVSEYDPYTIPPRLYDNLNMSDPFAQIYNWPPSSESIRACVHTAYNRRLRMPSPDLSRDLFAQNRTASSWTP